MPANHHINPRFRAYGKARIDITRRAQSEAEFQQLWHPPANSFPFVFSQNEWKFCIEYKVDDFAAEVGFYIDILGFTVLSFSPSYAQFAAPGGDYCVSVAALREDEKSTPAEAIRLQFKVTDILSLAETLEKRGILFECKPEPIQPGSPQAAGYFRTPHGVCVDLWGEIAQKSDIHELLDEQDQDEAETDAIIQRLLNLPKKDPEESQESFMEAENDAVDDTLAEGDQTSEMEKDGGEPERDPPNDFPKTADKPSTPAKSITPPHPQTARYSGKPLKSSRDTSSNKPSWSHRGNGELTYQPIDDSEIPDEDDL